MSTPLSIGIDFGGTSVKLGVVRGAEILDHAPPIATQDYPEAASLIDDIARSIEGLLQRFPDVAAVGAGLPGFVDCRTGTVHNLTNVPGWRMLPFRDELRKRVDLPTFIDNDANAMAWAEWKYGAGKGFQHIVALTLGTGVGGGLIIDGKLARGANFVGGEIGQMSIDYEGRVGAYRNRGALEDYIGNREIAADARKIYEEAGESRGIDKCSPKELAIAARAGDAIALQIWDGIGEKLASALLDCCFLLNPEVIIMGGGVAQAGECLFAPVTRHLHSQLGTPFKEHLKILPAKFGNEAGILGAAGLALAAESELS